MAPKPFRETLHVVLEPGPFRRYMAGESVSTTGTWMQMMAQGYLMTTLTHSAFMLGLANFAGGLPGLVLFAHAGSAADRFDKRRILLLAQVAQVALAVLMGVLIATGRIRLWHVIAIAGVLGLVAAFEMPAVSALVPELVAPHEIADAIAVDRSTFHLTRMVGPALGGLLVGAFGTAAAFFANAASFLALIASLLSLPARPTGTPEEEAQRQGGMREGLAYVRSDAPTLAMIALLCLNTFLIFPFFAVMMPLYTRDVLGQGATAMGLMMGLGAMGSFVGSILLLGVAPEARLGRLAFACVGVVAGLVGLSAGRGFWGPAIAMLVVMTCVSTLFGLANTTIQERAPGPMRGRVSAVAGLSFFGLSPIAGLGVTALSDRIGMRAAMVLAAVLFGLGAAYVLAGPAREALRQPRSAEPEVVPG